MTAPAVAVADRSTVAPAGPPPRHATWLAVGLVLLVAAALASVAFGARPVGWGDVVDGLRGHRETLAQIAVRERVPRTVLAVVVGAALSVGGLLLQAVTRNPLADPGILGVSSGAAAAVVVGFTWFGLSSPASTVWVAIAGSGAAAVAVWFLGSLGRGGPSPVKIALAGAAVWASLSSLVSAFLLPRVDVMERFRFWQIGGVSGAGWDGIVQVLPFTAAGAVLCLATVSGLDALALGDDVAAGLGVRVVRTRLLAALGAVTLCGAATAVAGPIGFVGLMGPHLTRLVTGPDHRRLVPLSAVVGATLLTAADVVGRVVARPGEVDVGVVTAFVGAPVFIAAVRRQRAR